MTRGFVWPVRPHRTSRGAAIAGSPGRCHRRSPTPTKPTPLPMPPAATRIRTPRRPASARAVARHRCQPDARESAVRQPANHPTPHPRHPNPGPSRPDRPHPFGPHWESSTANPTSHLARRLRTRVIGEAGPRCQPDLTDRAASGRAALDRARRKQTPRNQAPRSPWLKTGANGARCGRS